MIVKKLSVVLIILSLFPAIPLSHPVPSLDRITVDVPVDFPTIQAAINNASNGETVFVHEGVYYENIIVNKTLSLVGEDMGRTIIDGGNSGTTLKATAENICVTNLTIRGGGSNAYESGLFISASYVNVTNCNIVENGLFGICVNNSANVIVSQCVIKQNKADGIILFDSDNNTFQENTMSENNFGFHFYSSNQNNILNNTLTKNILAGVDLFYSTHNLLSGNVLVENSGHGIVLEYSSDNNRLTENIINSTKGNGLTIDSSSSNILRNNRLDSNTYNFYCPETRPTLSDFLNDIDTSNTANGLPITYIVSKEGMVIDPTSFPNIGYLALVNCTYMLVRNISLSGNGQGLLLAFTNHTVITDLRLTQNRNGLQLLSSTNNKIISNVLLDNSEDGIALDYASNENVVNNNTVANSSRAIRIAHRANSNNIVNNLISKNTRGLWVYASNTQNVISNNIIIENTQGMLFARENSGNTITQNTIADNSEGLNFEYSSNNLIFNNNFINNTVQVVSNLSSNAWDNRYQPGGNYWSDYLGEDLNYDGVGDSAHVLDQSNQDHYPLMGSFHSYNASDRDEDFIVTVFSNSTISDFNVFLSTTNPQNRTIKFKVAGEGGFGFCNICIPHTLMNGTYSVTIDDATPYYVNYSVVDNGTHRWIYFAYEHTQHIVTIVPESSSLLIIALIATVTLSVSIVRRRKAHTLKD